MPFNDPDATDPMTLHGVEIETDDANASREMAICFIEEYARLGFSPKGIMEFFLRPDFAGPRMAVTQLGRDAIAALIDGCFLSRGPRSTRVSVDNIPETGIRLPVLESKE